MIKKIILLVSMLCIITSSAFAMDPNFVLGPINWNTTPEQLEQNFNVTKIIHQENYKHIKTDKILNKNQELIFIENCKINIGKDLTTNANVEVNMFDGKIWQVVYYYPNNKQINKQISKELKKNLGKPQSNTTSLTIWNCQCKLLSCQHNQTNQVTSLHTNSSHSEYLNINLKKQLQEESELKFYKPKKLLNLSEEQLNRYKKSYIFPEEINKSMKWEEDFKKNNPKFYKEIEDEFLKPMQKRFQPNS